MTYIGGFLFISFSILVIRKFVQIWKVQNQLTDAKLNGKALLVKKYEKQLNRAYLLSLIYFASYAVVGVAIGFVVRILK